MLVRPITALLAPMIWPFQRRLEPALFKDHLVYYGAS